jgi:cyclophilin family peptidyl-prolyl cis-trans isomerase
LVRRSIIVVIIAAIVGFTAYKLESGPTTKLTAQQKANQVAIAAHCPSSPATRVNTLQWKTAPPMTIQKNSTYYAFVQTDLGPFTIRLDPGIAPVTVNNFIFLADHDYYKCNTFDRVIPTFMNQTGDPTGTTGGSPGYTIADEYPKKAKNAADQYPLGSVALANTGKPHSGAAQFFIVAGPEGEGLANTYTLFGQVISGLPVVEKINADGSAAGVPPTVTHRILSITISSKA